MKKRVLLAVLCMILGFTALPCFIGFAEGDAQTEPLTEGVCTVSVATGEGFTVISEPSVMVTAGETATFTLRAEEGYVLFASSHGAIAGDVLTVPGVTEDLTVEVLAIPEAKIFNGADDLTNTDKLYDFAEGMKNELVQEWNVATGTDLTVFGMGGGGSSRYMTYAVGNISVFTVRALVYNSGNNTDGRISFSFSSDGGKTFEQIAQENIELSILEKGPAENPANYYEQIYSLNGDTIPENSLIKITFPEVGGNWWDFSVMSVFAEMPYTVTVAEGEHYSVIKTEPDSLEGLGYGTEVKITIEIAEGWRLTEQEYSNYGTADGREGEIVLTLNTKDLPSGGAQIILNVEEIPSEFTVTLKHDENSHFTADVYQTTVDSLGATAVFTGVNIDAGYSFAGISGGEYDASQKTITVSNVQQNSEVVFTVKENNEQTVGEISFSEKDEWLNHIFDTSGNLYQHIEGNGTGMIGMNSGEAGYVVFQFDGNVSELKLHFMVGAAMISEANMPKIKVSADNVQYSEIQLSVSDITNPDAVDYPQFDVFVDMEGYKFLRVDFAAIDNGNVWDRFTLHTGIVAYGYYDLNLAENEHYELVSPESSLLQGLGYDEEVKMTIKIADGWRLTEQEYSNYGTADGRDGEIVLTLNTKDLPAGGAEIVLNIEEIPSEVTVTLKHDENSHFTADKYEVTVKSGETASFTLTAEEGYILFGSSQGTIEGNILSVSNVIGNVEIEVLSIHEEKVFDGADDLTSTDKLYSMSDGMAAYTYNTWDVNEGADLTVVSAGGGGTSRYLVYAVGEVSGFSVWTRVGKGAGEERFVLSVSTDGGKTFTSISEEYLQFSAVASGPNGSDSYYDQQYYVSGEWIPANSLIKIGFPASGGNWWDVGVLRTECLEPYTVSVAESEHYTVTETDPGSLEGLGYGVEVRITIRISDGWRLTEQEYSNYGTADGREGEIVLTLNTKDLPSGGAQIILNVEEIPAEITVTLEHNEESHFTSDKYILTTSEIGGTLVFTGVTIDEGYTFAGLNIGVYDAEEKTITIENAQDNLNIVFTVKKSNVKGVGTFSLGTETAINDVFDRSSNVVWGHNDGGQITTDDWKEGYVVYQFDKDVSAVTLNFMFKGYWFNNNCLPVIKVSADNISYTDVTFGKDEIIASLGSHINNDNYYNVNFTVLMDGYEFLRVEFAATAENDSFNKFKLNKEIVARGYQNVEIADGEHFTVEGKNEVAYGSNAVFTVTIDEGYEFYLVNELEFDEYFYNAETHELTIYNVTGSLSLSLVIIKEGENPSVEIMFKGSGYSMPDGMIYTAAAGEEFTVEVTPNVDTYFVSASTGSFDAETNMFTMTVPEHIVRTEVELNFKVPVFPTKNIHLDDLTDAEKFFTNSSGVTFQRYDADVPMRDLTVAAGQGEYIVYFLPENTGAVRITANVSNGYTGSDAVFEFSKDNQNYTVTDGSYIERVVTKLAGDYYSNISYTIQVWDESDRFIKITLPSNTGAWYDWSLASVEIVPIFNVEVKPTENCTAEVVSVNPGGEAKILIQPAEGYVFHYAYDENMNAVGTYDGESGTLIIEGIYEDLKLSLYVLPEGEAPQWLVSVKGDEHIIFGESGHYLFVNNGANAVFNVTFEKGYSFGACEGASYDEEKGTLTVFNVGKPIVITLTSKESAFEQKIYTVQVIDSQGTVVGTATGIKRGESAVITLNLPEGVEVIGVSDGKYDKQNGTLLVERVDGNMTVRVETIVKSSSDGQSGSNQNLKVVLIVIGSVLGAAAIGVGVFLFIKFRRKKNG